MVPKLAKLEPINTKRTTIPMFNCWKLKTADLDVSMMVTQLSLSVTLSSLSFLLWVVHQVCLFVKQMFMILYGISVS